MSQNLTQLLFVLGFNQNFIKKASLSILLREAFDRYMNLD